MLIINGIDGALREGLTIMFEQYVKTNTDGELVLDYDLLDIASRSNLLRDLELLSQDVELYLDDEDFTSAEKADALENAAVVEINNLWLDNALIDDDTEDMLVERLARLLARKYEVELYEFV